MRWHWREWERAGAGMIKTLYGDTCEACRWWTLLEGTVSTGVCRRNPPLAFTDKVKPRLPIAAPGIWPETSPGDYCGEWAQREAVPATGEALQ